jgi:hypothetical protein
MLVPLPDCNRKSTDLSLFNYRKITKETNSGNVYSMEYTHGPNAFFGILHTTVYPEVSGLERELQMVQLSATRYSCIVIL